MVGVREGGTQALRFDVVRVPQELPLSSYLNSGWMENVDKSSVEESTIGGYPAATAAASSDQWQFRIYALRVGGDVYRFIFAAKDKTGDAEKSFRETVNSFRRLTLAEIQAARPLRVKIVSVKPGDTVESMSRRMQGVDRPLERFRIINGLDQRAALRPNDRVKIVVD
ncbi:Putative Zn-dependent protease [Afipia felis]|uniref:Zn-dependent protease n=1 Tax=Afipia felis TaxID=1035 RepID=A0A090N8R6_AFIFE|nr:Putative Zn-dependent protease [Afipia felis]